MIEFNHNDYLSYNNLCQNEEAKKLKCFLKKQRRYNTHYMMVAPNTKWKAK